MARNFLIDSKAGDLINDVYVVTNAQLAASSNGKHYIKAFVSDRTAQLTARLWNATREQFQSLPENAFVRVRGRVENYQNNLQLIIEEFRRAEEGTFEVEDLLPHTTRDIEEMCQRVFAILGSIQHVETKALVQAFLDDEDLMNDFARAPAASSFHHAYIGGLLEHTLNLLEIVDKLLPLYPLLSRDLCLAGAFLHDIGKTWELSYEAAFSYTNGGQLIGHVVKGAMMVEEKSRRAEQTLGRPLSREIVELVQHMVLSHHEKLEHGSPKPPSTPEAVFVAMIDNLDAKVHMALSAARGPSAPSLEESLWTEFLKPFGYRMYRPDPTVNPSPQAGEGGEGEPEGGLAGMEPAGVRSIGAPAPVGGVTPVARVKPTAGPVPPATPAGESPSPAGGGQAPSKAREPGKVAISNPLFETAFSGKKK